MPFKLEYNSNFYNILVKHLNVAFQPIWQPYIAMYNKVELQRFVDVIDYVDYKNTLISI